MNTTPNSHPHLVIERRKPPLLYSEGPGGSRSVWAAFGILGLLLVSYLVTLLVRSSDGPWFWADGWGVCALDLAGTGLCFVRAISAPRKTLPLILGAGLLAWTLGDLAMTLQSAGGGSPPTPSVADLFYIAFYPLAYGAVLQLIRREARDLKSAHWLDGAIAGTGAAAVCACFAFHDIVRSTGGDSLGTATNLAYPVGDVLLLGLVMAGMAILSRRSRSAWLPLAAGLAINVVGDTANLFQNSIGGSRIGVVINAIAWPTAIVVMAMAVWVRPSPRDLLAGPRPSKFLLPTLGAGSALVILLAGCFHSIGWVAIGLAAVTLILVGARLETSVRAIQSVSIERHRQSITDELTGLRNRRYLFQVLDTFFDEQVERGTPESLAFLFVDLNHFKEINDSFGHPAGDELLRQLGGRLKGTVRPVDVAVRLGGDEFAILLLGATADEARTVAERVTHSLAQPFALDVVTANLSASIGIAMAPDDATDSAGLLWSADVAMYRAKVGNNSFATFQLDLDFEQNQLQLLEELRGAISNGDLVLHYQPQLDLRTGRVTAVEALLRWLHPTLGLIPPAKFVPLAEGAGLMHEVTELVVRQAMLQCAIWWHEGKRVAVAINVSPSNLLESSFVDLIRDNLAANEIPPELIVIEITENCVIADFAQAQTVIEQLRSLGVVVSIDDFGAGATSLAYLGHLAVGELKLDRVFVAGLTGMAQERDLDLVQSTINLGHALGLRIVAEGVEDESTLELLSSMGCDIAQGYVISHPRPAGEIAFRSDVDGARVADEELLESA